MERHEANILTTYLPPMLSEAEVDAALRVALAEQEQLQGDPRKVMGILFRAFYSNVDKSTVDPEQVKKRAEILLSQSK